MPPVTAAQRRRARRIATELAGLDFALPGTIAPRFVRCSKPGCRCMADPPRLHGPYLTWTRKLAGKTITRRLTEEQYAAYRPWFEAGRRVHALIGELEALSLEIIEAELRPETVATKIAATPRRKTPAT